MGLGDLGTAITVLIALVYVFWAVTTTKNDETRRLKDDLNMAKTANNEAEHKLNASKDDKEAWEAYKKFKEEHEVRSNRGPNNLNNE